MKKKYSIEDLAKIVRQSVIHKYDNPQKVLEDFQTNISRKIKSLSKRELTDNEVTNHSLSFANEIFNNLDRITLDYISAKLSNELINESSREGLNYQNTKIILSNLLKKW